MNVLEKQIAVDVMRKIIRRPIARLFSTNDVTGVTLNDIAERLDRGLFPSFDAWKSQVESLFDQYAKHKTDSVSVSAQQLKSEFESELEKLLPQKNAHCYEMTKLREQLGMIAKELDPPLAVTDAEPASVAFQAQDAGCVDLRRLKRDIEMFHSPEIILRVASFLVAKQPDAVVIGDGKLVFDFAMMREAVVGELRAFVTGLLRKVARGELDPFRADVGLVAPRLTDRVEVK